MPAIHVEIKKGHTENSASVMRKFTKRMQSAGVLQRARSLRYFERQKSKNVDRKQALRRLDRREKFTELFKLGKISEHSRGKRGFRKR